MGKINYTETIPEFSKVLVSNKHDGLNWVYISEVKPGDVIATARPVCVDSTNDNEELAVEFEPIKLIKCSKVDHLIRRDSLIVDHNTKLCTYSSSTSDSGNKICCGSTYVGTDLCGDHIARGGRFDISNTYKAHIEDVSPLAIKHEPTYDELNFIVLFKKYSTSSRVLDIPIEVYTSIISDLLNRLSIKFNMVYNNDSKSMLINIENFSISNELSTKLNLLLSPVSKNDDTIVYSSTILLKLNFELLCQFLEYDLMYKKGNMTEHDNEVISTIIALNTSFVNPLLPKELNPYEQHDPLSFAPFIGVNNDVKGYDDIMMYGIITEPGKLTGYTKSIISGDTPSPFYLIKQGDTISIVNSAE